MGWFVSMSCSQRPLASIAKLAVKNTFAFFFNFKLASKSCIINTVRVLVIPRHLAPTPVFGSLGTGKVVPRM